MSASTNGRFILCLLIFVLSGMVQAQSYQKRLALVIGNSSYQNGGDRTNETYLNSKKEKLGN